MEMRGSAYRIYATFFEERDNLVRLSGRLLTSVKRPDYTPGVISFL